MIRTLSGWWYNAEQQLELMWDEPLSFGLLLAGLAFAAWALSRRPRQPLRAMAMVGTSVWLVAALAMTIYPLDYLEAPSRDRFRLQSIIPFTGLVDGLVNSGGFLMTPEQYEEARHRVAEEFDIPLEEVVLDRYVRGSGVMPVLKDPIGNVVLFLPLGLCAPLVWPGLRRGWRIFVLGAGFSAGIELSQALFGLGSLGTIDDVIANATGALLGFLAGRAMVSALVRPRGTRFGRLPGPTAAG